MIKNIYIEGIGDIVLARRRGTRSIRLSISGGRVRLGAPFGVSEAQAIKFAISRQDWILKHLRPESLLEQDAQLGKAHRLRFEPTTAFKPSSKLSGNLAIVYLPTSQEASSSAVQTAAKRVSKKALLAEAESLLPQRLQFMATRMNVSYRSLKIKFIRSRWGSCTNQNDIVLNGYLMQLPWDIIDYVIAHELAHTKQHNHSPAFWALVDAVIPDFKAKRKVLKTYHTDVVALSSDQRAV